MYSGEPVLPVWEAATPLSIKEWIRFKNRFKKTGGELQNVGFVCKLVLWVFHNANVLQEGDVFLERQRFLMPPFFLKQKKAPPLGNVLMSASALYR